jgi:hypothetical protein
MSPIILHLGEAASEIIPWGSAPSVRDAQLRQFYKSESVLMSSIGIVTSRNSAMEWKLTGPDRVVRACHRMMQDANFGRGMLDFTIRFCIDLYTQDKGAFVEIIKENPRSQTSATIGFANLDAGRCSLTGNPEFPVIYQDRAGTYHKLPYWRVYHAAEMATTEENTNGLQICAVSRILNYARNHRDYVQYESEKIGGRFSSAVHLVQGVTAQEITNAITLAKVTADQAGQSHYMMPAIAASLNPLAKIEVATLALKSLPDGFDQEENFKQYITIIAMALLTDYLELAPLPGGGLGSATQSDQLDKKSQAKGAENFRKLFAQMFNNAGILPTSVEFAWMDNDFESERVSGELLKIRAEARALMLANGELNAKASLQMAFEAGDISQEIYDMMLKVVDEMEKKKQEAEAAAALAAATPDPENDTTLEQNDQPDAAKPASGTSKIEQDSQGQKGRYFPNFFAG